jgi:hypothetical protein
VVTDSYPEEAKSFLVFQSREKRESRGGEEKTKRSER